ncbi:sugar kinase [Nocardia caishijiensis]|uniref:2-dehydro-3-deoxygluconokinase n=1 Tax=Nocardia caishijiensis TaxID=184756 RepID=A0ABQ6YHE9_9NOCA|nr:sugar kinase [Nocardia caishijiensis]KAF0845136.1 2-dehydro-3-deoxygluconokinase [Nocardia caishijiensis]
MGEGLAVLVAEPGPLERSGTFERSAGGAEANVAVVLAQLGVSAAWLSRVGDDGFGRYLVAELARAGVDVGAVAVDPTRPTGIYIKERGGGSGTPHDLPSSESRMHYYRSGSAASALAPADLVAPPLVRADLVHFTGITPALSESACALTRSLLDRPRHGSTISFDLNYRPAVWGARIGAAADELAAHVRGADVVLLGADEATEIFGTGDPGALRALFPEPAQLIVKNDKHTAIGFDGEQVVEVPALDLTVTERIGAGDAFAGGYLAALLHGADLRTRLRYGHLCAAAALTASGDAAKLPPPQELRHLAGLPDAVWTGLTYPPSADGTIGP